MNLIKSNPNKMVPTQVLRLNNKNRTQSVRFTFNQPKLPAFILPIFQFNHPVTFCYNCHRQGHKANKCTNGTFCAHFTGPHKYADCDETSQSQERANCRGPHRPTSNQCPKNSKITKVANHVKTTWKQQS